MIFRQELERLYKSQELFGFSIWRSLGATLWGRVIEVREDSVCIAEVDPLGQPDGVNTFGLDEIQQIEHDPTYAVRLERLSRLNHAERSSQKWIRGRKERVRRLHLAATRGEVLTVRFADKSQYSCRLL